MKSTFLVCSSASLDTQMLRVASAQVAGLPAPPCGQAPSPTSVHHWSSSSLMVMPLPDGHTHGVTRCHNSGVGFSHSAFEIHRPAVCINRVIPFIVEECSVVSHHHDVYAFTP